MRVNPWTNLHEKWSRQNGGVPVLQMGIKGVKGVSVKSPTARVAAWASRATLCQFTVTLANICGPLLLLPFLPLSRHCGTTHCNMYVCIYIHTQTMDHCSPLRSWTRCRLVSAIYLCNEHKTSETRVSPFAPRHATPPCPLECAPFRGNRTTGLVPQCAHVPMWPCGFYSRFRIHPADDSMVRCECRQVNWQDAHAAYA